ncbi:hypothetical protein [Quadrisphaera sp. KR29]|uniref:hypothetical protein n=1 Tax=Quadrisphaera sp. KR29 TaxID=3461391 RepID=UPI004044103C
MPGPLGDPFATLADGTGTTQRAAASPPPGLQPAPPAPHVPAVGGTPTPPLGTALPSRRDRAALRRPTALDEAAVQASDSAAWRTSPALEDPRTASAISRPAPLTRALARTLTEHLDSLTPPPSVAGRTAAAPAVYVPRRRSAPAVSGPLPVVGTTEPLREPSWTTGPTRATGPSWTTDPVAGARPLRPQAGAPSRPAAPVDALGEPDLPPPPPAAEVEAALRARAARVPTAPVPPPVPQRSAPEPAAGRSSVLVPPAALPQAAPPRVGGPGAVRAGTPQSGPTAALTAADLAAVRAATASLSPTPDTSTAGPATAATPAAAPGASTSVLHPEGRHGRAGARTGRAARTSARSGPAARGTDGRSSRPAPRPDATAPRAPRRWHQRRALGVPVGLLAAAGALAVAVVVGVWSTPGHPDLSAALTSAGAAVAPAQPTPPAAAPQEQAPSAAPEDAGGQAAGTPQEAAGSEAPAASEAPATAPADAPASSAAPADAALIPTGDVTYEGFGTAQHTYVELGTADHREVREDLGSTFTQPAAGSKDWPGWYVAVYSYDGPEGGSVGCRIKDADGRVLEEQSSADGQLVMCSLGSPAGLR